MAGQDGGVDRRFRQRIALTVLVTSVVAIVLIAGLAVWASEGSARADITQNVFNAVLPVVAAWVGTVLAFYFGQASFESGSQQARKAFESATPELEERRPITEFMRPIYDMTLFDMADREPSEIPLSKIRAEFERSRVNRLLIIDGSSRPRFFVHKSRIDSYALAKGHGDADNLDMFIEDEKRTKPPRLYGDGSGFITVAASQSLADVRARLDANPGVSDIVVTRNGSAMEPVLGWMSDRRIHKPGSA